MHTAYKVKDILADQLPQKLRAELHVVHTDHTTHHSGSSSQPVKVITVYSVVSVPAHMRESNLLGRIDERRFGGTTT